MSENVDKDYKKLFSKTEKYLGFSPSFAKNSGITSDCIETICKNLINQRSVTDSILNSDISTASFYKALDFYNSWKIEKNETLSNTQKNYVFLAHLSKQCMLLGKSRFVDKAHEQAPKNFNYFMFIAKYRYGIDVEKGDVENSQIKEKKASLNILEKLANAFNQKKASD